MTRGSVPHRCLIRCKYSWEGRGYGMCGSTSSHSVIDSSHSRTFRFFVTLIRCQTQSRPVRGQANWIIGSEKRYLRILSWGPQHVKWDITMPGLDMERLPASVYRPHRPFTCTQTKHFAVESEIAEVHELADISTVQITPFSCVASLSCDTFEPLTMQSGDLRRDKMGKCLWIQ